MNEIERIIKENWKPVFKPIDECDFSELVKAIEQYVVKARISVLEGIEELNESNYEEQDIKINDLLVKWRAELKRGLQGEPTEVKTDAT